MKGVSRDLPDGTRQCKVCQECKLQDAFQWRDRVRGLRRSECKACCAVVDKQRRSKDVEAYNARHLAWWNERKLRMSAAELEALRAKQAINVKAWTAANKAHLRAYRQEWLAANGGVVLDYWRKRRARKRQACIQQITKAQLEDRMSVFGFCCAYCGGPFEEIDHVKPLARGGYHCLANLRPACGRCNRIKWAKSPFQWLAQNKRLQCQGT